MRLIPKLYISVGVLLSTAVGGAILAIVSAREASFHLYRANLAHQNYEAYVSLSSHTYQLFKQFGDAMLIGDRDRGEGENELLDRIRSDIARIRNIIAEEIQLVGEEEFEELDRLAEIELQIEDLLNEYSIIIDARESGLFDQYWSRLSRVLDEKVDRDFNALIQESLIDEAGEVEDTRQETGAKTRLFQLLAGVFGLFATVAAAASVWVLVRNIREPVRALVQGAEALEKGDTKHRIEVVGKNELYDVGRAFNSMADRIAAREEGLSRSNLELEAAVNERTGELKRALEALKSNEAKRIRLLADVSHELRTPLTVIRGEADVALRGGTKSSDEYQEALHKCRDAAQHTTRLVDDLLFVARREAGELRLNKGETDLSKLMPDIIEDSRSLADGPQDSISFVSELLDATVRIDSGRIRQVVMILLENALHYGGGDIEVRLDQAASGYAISVTDDGPGMTEEERVRAFDRFFRGSNAAEHYASGTGLGLPVAKAIVEAHGGIIALGNAPSGGLVVSFTLPTRPQLQAVS